MMDNRDEGAPFNMAIDTLMRVADILRAITNLTFTHGKDERQEVKLDLTRSLIIAATPLLKPEVEKKYRKKIFNLKVNLMKKVDKSGRVKEIVPIFSEELEDELDNVIIDIQRELQVEGKYFMPSNKDPKYGWKQ